MNAKARYRLIYTNDANTEHVRTSGWLPDLLAFVRENRLENWRIMWLGLNGQAKLVASSEED